MCTYSSIVILHLKKTMAPRLRLSKASSICTCKNSRAQTQCVLTSEVIYLKYNVYPHSIMLLSIIFLLLNISKVLFVLSHPRENCGSLNEIAVS